MTDYVFEQMLAKARDAQVGGHEAWRAQSTGEKLASALILNRFDWLVQMDYTIAEALNRVGEDWARRIPAVANALNTALED